MAVSSVVWMRMEGEVSRVAGDGFFWRVRHFETMGRGAVVAVWDEIAATCDAMSSELAQAPEPVRVSCARTMARHVAEGCVVMYARALDACAAPRLERAWAASCGMPMPGDLVRASDDFGTCARELARSVMRWSSMWGMGRLSAHHAVDVAVRIAAKETRDARIPRDIHIMRLATSQLGREGFSWFDEGFATIERSCAEVLAKPVGMRACSRMARIMSRACDAGVSGEAMLEVAGADVGVVLGVSAVDMDAVASHVAKRSVAHGMRGRLRKVFGRTVESS